MDIKKLKEEIHKESYRSDPRSLIDVIDVDTLIDIIEELQAKNNDALDLVSQQRELLKVFIKWHNEEFSNYDELPEHIIDMFIKTFNCG